MKLIRIIKNWKTPDLLRQTPGCKGTWNNIQFTLDTVSECDYVVVFNRVTEDTVINCPRGNIWAMLQEPYIPGVFDWMIEGHDDYAKIFTHYIFNDDPRYIATQTCLPWHVNKTYDELRSAAMPEKTKTLSWITTNKTTFPGHKERMCFYEGLKGDRDLNIDIYGYGIRDIEDKWDALAPYKYSLAVENSSSENYWTEKLADCFLSYTLPIYYGCTNLEKYFPENSFIRIDINDYKQSREIIENLVHEDIWKSRLEAIKEARDLVLNKYQLFPFIADYIASVDNESEVRPDKEKIVVKAHSKKTEMQKVQPKISVVVCTYNRQDVLPDCLDSLINQNVDSANYEVIIINNNSTDSTQAVAESYVKNNYNFQLHFQPEQGLSHARNMGIAKANAEYIAYIDDDARVPENWIYTALRIIKEHKPDIFGGPAFPIFPGGKPEWYKDEYGIRGDMGETGWIQKGFIIGTNIFFRKCLLVEYGGFDPDLGMKGDSIGYHEETRLVRRAFTEGRKVFYCKELFVRDLIPDYKKSLAFFIQSKFSAGLFGVDLWKPEYNDHEQELSRLMDIISETMEGFNKSLMQRDVERYPYPENYIIENLVNNFFQIGIRIGFFNKIRANNNFSNYCKKIPAEMNFQDEFYVECIKKRSVKNIILDVVKIKIFNYKK
jgi:glycosyltransferase involved in cell wall biosynthesis